MNEVYSTLGIAAVGLLIRVTWQLATISAAVNTLVKSTEEHDSRLKELEKTHV